VGIEAGVLGRNRLAALGRQAHQALPEGNTHVAHGASLETDGGAQGQMLEVRISQVDRADIRFQPLDHQTDDIIERLLQIVRSGDNLGDVRKK
jgi:hypothetical protein